MKKVSYVTVLIVLSIIKTYSSEDEFKTHLLQHTFSGGFFINIDNRPKPSGGISQYPIFLGYTLKDPNQLKHLYEKFQNEIITMQKTNVFKETFDTLLLEGNFIQAYQMAANNEQGNLWKRQVVAKTKKELTSLAYKSIYQDAAGQRDLTLANDILRSFERTPHHAELTVLFTEIRTSAQSRYNTLIQNPQIALLVQSGFSDVMRQFLNY